MSLLSEPELDELISVIVPSSMILLSMVYTNLSAPLRSNLLTVAIAGLSCGLIALREAVAQSLASVNYTTKAVLFSLFVLEMLFWALDLYRQRVYLERRKGDVDASRKR